MTNAIATVASNHAAYDAAKDDARILGDNFRTANNRKRKMAVNFITAVVREDWQLEALIDECKTAMKYRKLEAKDQSQAATFFSDLRFIVGKWSKLTPEVQNEFLDGKIVYSTLKARMKDAVKKAEEAEDMVEATKEAGAQASAQATAEQPAQAQAQAQAEYLPPHVQAMRDIAAWLDAGVKPEAMDPLQMVALKNMIDAVDEFRASVSKQVKLAA